MKRARGSGRSRKLFVALIVAGAVFGIALPGPSNALAGLAGGCDGI
jgi:hypothetical protein